MLTLTQDGAFAHHARMILAGFLVGSVFVIPAALIASGRFSSLDGAGEKRPVAREASLVPAAKEALPTATDAPPAGALPAIAPPSEMANLTPRLVKTERIEPDPEELARRALDERVETARTLVRRGEVLRARELLSKDTANPAAAFALAEAFDPNVLASLNLVGVRSEVERARQLYAKALSGGVAAARQRLDALQ